MDRTKKRILPIWIGRSCQRHCHGMEGINFSRPMTHDLIRDILSNLGIEVLKVEVHDLRNNTFFANIHLLREGKTQVIDSRPSDALALALRAGAPIYVEERVIEKSRNIDGGTKITDLEKEKEDKLKEFLENLDPDDFGKYKM